MCMCVYVHLMDTSPSLGCALHYTLCYHIYWLKYPFNCHGERVGLAAETRQGDQLRSNQQQYFLHEPLASVTCHLLASLLAWNSFALYFFCLPHSAHPHPSAALGDDDECQRGKQSNFQQQNLSSSSCKWGWDKCFKIKWTKRFQAIIQAATDETGRHTSLPKYISRARVTWTVLRLAHISNTRSRWFMGRRAQWNG